MELLKIFWRELAEVEFSHAVALIAGTLSLLRLVQPRPKPLGSIPYLSSWIPYLGLAPAYFASPNQFTARNRAKYGDSFAFEAFGGTWLVLFDRKDIDAAMNLPEKKASLPKAYFDFAGPALPRDTRANYGSNEAYRLISNDCVSGTPMVAHSVRPARTRAWVPSIRNVISELFDTLPGEGEVELFEWCRDLICAITVRVLMGDRVNSTGLLQEWVSLFHQADPESAFRGPHSSLSTIAEVSLRGERQIYGKVRELIYPYVDQEMDACVAGEPEPEDASVLTSFVRSWYARLKHDPSLFREARTRLANDMFFFTFAAFSNSFAAAAWILFHTMRNTNGVGDRIRAELDRSIKSGNETFADCPEFERTMLEIVRLYTPGSVHRKLMVDWKMPSTGETIPAGTTYLVNVCHVHRNPDIYDKPNEFDPGRYESNGDERLKAGCSFMPFGAGTHPCPGKRFAVLETAVFVSEALKHFDLSLFEDETFGQDKFTNSMVNIPRHPSLDPTQTGFVWRPTQPIMVRYRRLDKH